MGNIKIPSSYFADEKREGFEISELMKRAWAAEMEVLKVVADICDSNNIKYFLFYGSLLGAVRHKGFIPWDDDIDIALLRPDYDRLVMALHEQLPDGFQVAGMYAKEKRLFEAAKTAQCRVIADETYWTFPRYLERFHCFPYPRIGIDIFPLDNVYADQSDFNEHMELGKELTRIVDGWDTFCKQKDFPSQIQALNQKYGLELEIDDNLEQHIWQLLDQLCTLCPDNESEEVTYVANQFRGRRYRFRKEWLDEVEEAPYEMVSFKIPKRYDEILTSIYGDYMVVKKGGAAHNYPFYRTQDDALQKLFLESGITDDVSTFCHNWYQLIHKGE